VAPSLVRQVNVAIEAMSRIGQSKAARKKTGKKVVGIYHGKTMKNYIGHCCTFAKWAQKKYGIKMLRELNREMGGQYFTMLKMSNRSPYSMRTIREALLKLEKGVKVAFHQNMHVIPKDLELPQRNLKIRRGRRAYTEEEVNAIITAAMETNKLAARAIELQSLFGLRKFELLNLRKTDIHFQRGKLIVWRGKGGRLREIDIPDKRAEKLLETLCSGIDEKALLFSGLTARRYQAVMEQACRKAGLAIHKTHNLRHHFAVKKYNKLLEAGKPAREARRETSQDLGHNRPDVLYSYMQRKPY